MIEKTISQAHACPIQKDQFTELILAPDGRIYLSSNFDDIADWSCVYYDSNVCIHHGDNIYGLGSLQKKSRWLPIAVGYTNVCEPEGGGCFLFSECSVLGDAASVFAVFRYKDMLALYLADAMISRGIYFALMKYTPEDEMLYTNIFSLLLHRHNPEAAENLTTWLKRQATNGREA